MKMKFIELRRKIGTQSDVAKLLNVDISTVGKWELGKAYPRRNMLKKIAEIFCISEGEVLTAIDNSKK